MGATAQDYSENIYRKLTLETVANITASLCDTGHGVNFITEFMKTKGVRFNKQISWIDYCLDSDSDDNQKKAGPKDEDYLQQVAWMKVIKGFGVNPVYHLEDEDADVVGVRDRGDVAVGEDVDDGLLERELRPEEAAGEDAQEQRGVDLLGDERQDDGQQRRNQRPEFPVEVALRGFCLFDCLCGGLERKSTRLNSSHT